MGEVTDLVSIITGGGGGIGKATALLLGADGAKVVVADMDVEAAPSTYWSTTRTSAPTPGRSRT